MRENYIYAEIPRSELPLKVVKAKNYKARLVQICAVSTDTGYDLIYSFADGYQFVNYKVALGFDEEIMSISNIFPSASLYENEMSELFGVKIDYINIDYNNRLYNIDVETPFKNKQKEVKDNG